MDTSYALDNSLYRTRAVREPTPPLMLEFDDIMTVPEDFELELGFALDLFDARAVPLEFVAEKDRQSIADACPQLPDAAAACANVVGWTPSDGRSFIVLDTPDGPAPPPHAPTMPSHDYAFLRGPNYLPVGDPANDYALSAPAVFTSPAWGTLAAAHSTHDRDKPQRGTAPSASAPAHYPRAPRGGVPPSVARTMTGIRVAREQARRREFADARAEAVARRAGSSVGPSVMEVAA